MLLSIVGIIALGINTIYWVEMFGADWSYTASLAWQAVVVTLAVIAALHIVCAMT